MWASLIQTNGSSSRTKRQWKGKSQPPHPHFLLNKNLPWTVEILVLGPLDSGTYVSSPLVVGHLASDWIMPQTFLIIPLGGGRLWDFFASLTIWTNVCNKFSPICLSLSTNLSIYLRVLSVQSSSVTQLCPTLCNPWMYARPPCSSPTPRVYSNSCPSSQWCHPAISFSVVPFSSCPQSLPASGSFPMSQCDVAKVLEFPLQHQSFQWTPRTDLL